MRFSLCHAKSALAAVVESLDGLSLAFHQKHSHFHLNYEELDFVLRNEIGQCLEEFVFGKICDGKVDTLRNQVSNGFVEYLQCE